MTCLLTVHSRQSTQPLSASDAADASTADRVTICTPSINTQIDLGLDHTVDIYKYLWTYRISCAAYSHQDFDTEAIFIT